MTTLVFNGTEMAMADWKIANCRRIAQNQAQDSVTFDVMAAADAADPFLPSGATSSYGAQIALWIGRTPSGGTYPGGNASLPPQGATAFTGGKRIFVGYCVQANRGGNAGEEKISYKFAGPWEFFFERVVFQKLWMTWNGSQNVADWRSQVVLGMSVNALVGPADTVPGTNATNLLSIAQQLKEIANYCAAISGMEQSINGLGWTAYNVAQSSLQQMASGITGNANLQFQFDNLTADGNGNYQLLEAPGPNCLIPDYLTGYAASGQTSAGVNQTGSAAANPFTVLRAPLDAVNDTTCGECMRKMLRWIGAIGSPVVWFDYTTSPPTLKVSTRDQLSGVTLPFPTAGYTGSLSGPNGALGATASSIIRRDDLVPPAVHLKYRVSITSNGSNYTQVINDIAATISGTVTEGVGQTGALQSLAQLVAGSGAMAGGTQASLQAYGRRPGSPSATLDLEGPNITSQAIVADAIPLDTNPSDPGYNYITGPGGDGGFWTSLFPELADVASLQYASDGNGNTFYPTITDDTGAAVNVAAPSGSNSYSSYGYRLRVGAVASWMQNSVGATGLVKDATIKARFQYTEQIADSTTGKTVSTKQVPLEEKTIRVTLTNLPTNPYAIVTPGEVVPYGLAGYVYNIEQILQYQGSYAIQETEITDQCPLGNNLNLSGGLAEWETMAACVQELEYDFDRAATTLRFGPAAHLGAQDFIERLRVNRGPRWYSLIGNNVTNSGTAGDSNPTNYAAKDSSKGSSVFASQSFLTNLAQQFGSSPAALPAGTHVNNSYIASGPGLLVAAGGTADAGSNWIGLWASDLANAAGAKLQLRPREIQVCYSTDSGHTWNPGYMVIICSQPYATALNINPSP